jgi:hypothetical protein
MAAPIFEKLARSYEWVSADALLSIYEPDSSPFSHELQSTLWAVATCTAFLAASFFFVTGTLAAFSLVTLSGSHAARYLLLPLASALLLRYPISWSELHQNAAEMLRAISDKLKKIECLSEPEMKALLSKHHFHLGRIPKSSYLSPEFKVLLAYYLHHLETNETVSKSLSKESFPYALSDQTSNSEIHTYYLARAGLKEFVVWRNKIHAACFAQKIYKPNVSIDLGTIGNWNKMSLGERQANLLKLGAQSPYFTFKGSKHPIRFGEMDGLTIEQIRQRIFE